MLKNEPITVSTVATIVSFLASKFALDMDANTAAAVATVVFLVGQAVARQLSTPVARAQDKIDAAWLADPARDPKPTV